MNVHLKLTLILPISFCPKNAVCFLHLLHTLQNIATMEVNIMNPNGSTVFAMIGNQGSLTNKRAD